MKFLSKSVPPQDGLMFSNRALFNLIVPIMVDTVLTTLAGVVDSTMVSSAGEAAVSAVSLVDSLSVLFTNIFSGAAMGGVVVTSQYLGRRDIKKAQTSASQLFYTAVILSTLITVILVPLIPTLLRLVYGGIEADVYENAKDYFLYIALGYPFLAVASACLSLLRTMSRSRHAMFLHMFTNVINIVGNAVLIFGFDMGAKGAAIATSFSRVVLAILGIWILHNKDLPLFLDKLYKVRLDFDILKRIFSIGGGNSLELLLFQLGKVLVASFVSSMGTIAIAANSVTNSINGLGWTAIGAFSTGTLTVVGHCLGAGEREQAKMYIKKLIKVSMLVTIVLFGAMFLFRNQLVMLFDFTDEARSEASYYLGFSSILTIITVYPLAFTPVSAFRAAGDTRYAVVMATSTMFIFRVGLAYLLGIVFNMGLAGVWIGMAADWACRGVLNIIHLRNDNWMKKKVI